jgi:carbamoylphosphate synthase large subunit
MTLPGVDRVEPAPQVPGTPFGSTTGVLVTSIGSLSAVGLVLCCEGVRASLRIIGTNSVARAPGNFLADKAYIVPDTADANAYRSAIERILTEEYPALVLNGRDEELGVLAALRDDGGYPGTCFLVPPAALVPVFNDKYETARFAKDHDLPFADTAYFPDEVERLLGRHGLPLIVKPRWDGHASKGVFLVSDERGIEAALATRRYVVQERLPDAALDESLAAWNCHLGMPWAWSVEDHRHEVDMVLGRRGEVAARCITVGATQGAIFRDLRILDDPTMRQVAEDYADVLGRLGHRGPLNLQGKLLPDGRYVPFELNARFTGATIGRAKLGFNAVLAALRHFCAIDPGAPELAPNGKIVERVPLFLAFEEDAARRLAETREWERELPAR